MTPGTGRRRIGRPLWCVLLFAYLVALLASHLVRASRPEPPAPPGPSVEVVVRGPVGEPLSDRAPVRVAYEEDLGAGSGLPVLYLHGSPGGRDNLERVGRLLADRHAGLRPDLPGFGRSSRELPSYSIHAHAAYVRDLLVELGIERCHVVGFSMGGGVALHLAREDPERVASVTLLASIGVQELELLGDHHLNHLVHALQLAGLGLLFEGTPHFGTLDGAMLSREYARNFYDSDQRPLRGILERLETPLLILHGPEDPLVPIAAAREHHRIAPHSELVEMDGSHFLPFRQAPAVAEQLAGFFARVEEGRASRRADASELRRRAAAAPFDPTSVPPLAGFGLVLFVVLVAMATLVSEDLTCIAVGGLVGQGHVSFAAGAGACFLGIFVGDLLLFLCGRWVGRRALSRAPFAWFLSPERVEQSSHWFERRGPVVIFLSRFLPGARLPTYFAAGALRTSFLRFALWFALAAGVWTPILVWVSSRVGGALARVESLKDNVALGLLVTLLAVTVLVRFVRPMLTHRGRRLLVSRWQRITRHEYWPWWIFYLPIYLWVGWLGLRHRRPFAFTAVNPCMPHSGFVGESKGDILRGLVGAREFMPAFLELRSGGNTDERLAAARRFLEQHGLDYPVVVKPDVGERGSGVRIVRNEAELTEALAQSSESWLLQEYVPGVEFGLFYARHPEAPRGEIFSVTRKRLPRVTGDGRRTLEELILDDPRAVGQARFFLESNAARLEEVPPAGVATSLGEIGSHCRGTLFEDGAAVVTRELEEALERVSRSFEGFHFGRFDVRAPSEAALGRGEFKILELNGVTAEAGSAYDPRHGLLRAWGILADQWRRAFAIGAAQAERGVRTSRLGELLAALRESRRAGAALPTNPGGDESLPVSPEAVREAR